MLLSPGVRPAARRMLGIAVILLDSAAHVRSGLTHDRLAGASTLYGHHRDGPDQMTLP